MNEIIEKTPIVTRQERETRDTKYRPLSFSQQRLWFLDQLEPNNPSYNILTLFRLTGSLDFEVLQQSLNKIVMRHEVLRTTFTTQNGKPVQKISPEGTVNISLHDLTDTPKKSREQEALQFAREESRRPFNLAEDTLLQVTLIQKDAQEYLLLVKMHHIISDAWSIGVLIKEIRAHYEALLTGELPLLPELSMQYSDYALWQNESFQHQESFREQLSYWKTQLDNAPPLELPTDHTRSALQTFEGARHYLTVPEEVTSSIKKLTREAGGTLFMTMLAAFNVLLYRYSSQRDLCVGTPIANRDRDGVEHLIGFFVNTLVLRTQITDDPTCRELLAQVREVALSAYENQSVPFEKLVEELHPERDLSRPPLFQVLFSLQNAPTESLRLPGLTLLRENLYNDMSKFDLTVYMWENESGIGGVFEYNKGLFTQPTIERMVSHFVNLLREMASNPERRISELALQSEQEKEHLLTAWNATDASYPTDHCLHNLFEAQAQKTPAETAVIFQDHKLTYSELNNRANQVAHALRKLGVGPDVPVAILFERSIDMIVGLLAILKAGGAYVPLDPTYPKDRLKYMLDDAQPSVLLTQLALQKRLITDLNLPGLKVVCLDNDNDNDIAKESTENPRNGISPLNLAYVIYTSGSTGKPKGVGISHRALINFLLSMQKKPGLQADDDKILAVTTLSFDIAGLELYLPLISGAQLILASKEESSDASRLRDRLTESDATVMQATPATWQMLLDGGWNGDAGLKILCGGEALPPKLAHRLIDCGSSLWNMYGPTETTIWSAIKQIEAKEEMIPIGPPIANTQMYVLDQNLNPVPVGVYGELYISGDGLARGYLKRAGMTAEKFIPNPFSDNGSRLYRTGDLVRHLPSGDIEFAGRIDHQVKVRGFRIELGEIEVALAAHEAVDKVVVVAGQNGGLAAYLISKSQERPTVSELRRFLTTSLPEYMVPNHFMFLDTFPLTPNGKINRKALPEPEAERPDLDGAFIAPRSAVEEVMANIWGEIIGVERVGVNDNFFELGGHSLLATQVVSRIRKIFRMELPLRTLFESPTVAKLSKVLVDNETKPGWVDQVATAMKKIYSMTPEERRRLVEQKRKAKSTT